MSVKWNFRISLFPIILCSALLIIGVRLFLCSPQSSQHLTDLIPWHTLLDDTGYSEVVSVDSPILPDTVPLPEELVTATTTGSGSWIAPEPINEGDTMAVELSEIVLEDGTAWIQVMVDSMPVIWQELEHFDRPAELGRWSAGLEAVIIPEFDIGAVAAYRIGTVLGVNGEVAVAVDINKTITDSPDWFAVEGRLSVPVWRSMELGAGGGLHISKDDICGHVAGGITIRF